MSVYEKDPLPSHYVCDKVAAEIGLSPKQVQRWFRRYRHKMKIDDTENDKGKRICSQYIFDLLLSGFGMSNFLNASPKCNVSDHVSLKLFLLWSILTNINLSHQFRFVH